MGFFDRLTGRREPPKGTPVRSDGEVVRGLMALNAPDVPYVVRGGSGEGADLVAEWRMTEPAWYSVFERSQLSRTFQVLMRLDPARREVRTLDKQWEVTWVHGVPTLSVSREYQRGVVTEFSTQKTWERGADGKYALSTTFEFSSEDLKTPLRARVLAAGWTWRPVAFGKL